MSDLKNYMAGYWNVIHISELNHCIQFTFPPNSVCTVLYKFTHIFYRDAYFIFQCAILENTTNTYIKVKNEIGIGMRNKVS